MLKKYQLRNGLNVILYPSHKAPVVSAQIWVNTGSADEQKGEEGLSHFIEHLVFKGSEKYPVGEIARRVEAAGGQLNAYTSFDQTVFYITLSKHFSETALDMLSQMMGKPLFDKEEIDNEREVVIEEIKRTKDSLGRAVMQNMFSTVYKKHPYGRPVIGYEKVVRESSAEKIVDYYKSHYSASNMTLLVVGDFDPKEMKKEIKNYFESIPSYKTQKAKRLKEPEQKQTRISVKKTAFKENRLSLSWQTVPATHKDTAALDVLAAVLGQYESSRLIRRLRVENPCVNFIFCSAFSPKDKGMFTIHMGLEPDQFATASKEFLSEIEGFLKEKDTSEDILRAVNNFESEEIFSKQTVDGIASNVGQYMFLTGDPNYSKEFLKQLRAISHKDLIRVFKKYLKPEKLSLAYTTNEEEEVAEKKVKELSKEYKKVFNEAKAVRGITEKPPKYSKPQKVSVSEKSQAKVETVKVGDGLEVLMLENHEAPMFHIQSAMLGGLRLENEDNNGIANLLSHLWTCGSDTLGETALSKELEKYSLGIRSFSGRNTIGLQMTALSRVQDKGLSLYLDLLLKKKFDEKVLERERKLIQTDIKNKHDQPAQIAIANFMKKLFHGHPYAKDAEGSVESLDRLNSKQVADFMEQHRSQKNMKIALVGSFQKDEVLKLLESRFKELQVGQRNDEKFEVTAINEDINVKEKIQKEQSHVFLGYHALSYKDENKFTLSLIESILAGQGGRLFLELRDKASLAYSVAPFHLEGLDTGCFAAYIACSPNKTETAIKMLKEEFMKLCEIPVGDEELDRAKKYLIGKHDIGLQKNSSLSSHILFDVLYGRPKEDYLEFANLIERITAKQVQEMARKIFSQKSVLSEVGV